MSEYWKVPVIWPGETAAVLASGPSMLTLRDSVQYLKGLCRVVAVNDQAIKTLDHEGNWHDPIAPWADVLYAADRKWWWENRQEAAKFAGIRVTINQAGEARFILPFDVKVVRNGGQEGYDDRPDHIKTGCNSGFQAVQLAAKLGAKRILLIGFDMRRGSRSHHWFGEHRWRVNHKSPYGLFIRLFEKSYKAYVERGIEIINCTPGSALKKFKMGDLGEVIHEMQRVRAATREDEAVLHEESA